MNTPCIVRTAPWALAALCLPLFFTGCVSGKYKPAKKDIPPPVPLSLIASTPSITATVQSVILYHGSGSWKRDAFWDEYLVSVSNRGDRTVTLVALDLTDFRGATTEPGEDPWLLEKQSLSRREEINRAAKTTLIQLGGGYLAVGAAGTVMFLSDAACGSAGAVTFAGVLPVYVVTAIVRNHHHRRDIEAEFARRRFTLPATVPPGQTRQGSFFFRISPGPQRLVLHARVDDEPHDVTIDLTPLGPLHLRPSVPPKSG